ncbi:MAG TPA: helix-turn-helix transcriptional regulator [Burkholderiaceae bacterium]|nr:helix-turn-helix transcriptional regulator [Burkholderiaceae bacterium]
MPAPSPRHADHPALAALGAAIRRVRLDRGISQEALAHMSAIDRAYMSSIERGKQNPGVVSVIEIATALGISVAELMMEASL